MFFGMTNSPAMFQAMMNKILRDLINEEKVAAFVDNILVGTETEDGHDEIVKEILESKMGPIPISLQFHFKACSRK